MDNIREKAVIYGGGQSTLDFLKYSSFFSDTIEICAISLEALGGSGTWERIP